MQGNPYNHPMQGRPPQPPKKTGPGAGRIFLGAFSVLIGLVSFPCTAAAIYDLISGTQNVSGALIMGIFFAMMSVVSVGLFYFAARGKKEAPFQVTEWHERRVLELARREGGLLSIGSVALNTELSIDQSSIVLEELERRGVANTWINDEGDLVYRFAALSQGPAHAQHRPQNPAMSELDAFDRQLQEATGGGQEYEFDFEQPQQQQQQQRNQPQQNHYYEQARQNQKKGSS